MKKSEAKAIIFDWGRTLYDSEAKKEFPETLDILEYCRQKGVRMAVASLVSQHSHATLEERESQIENSPLREYFEAVRVTDSDKDMILDELVLGFGLPRENILIVDDRTVRGIRYGNAHGHPTVWLQKGKFASELPNEATGQPTFTIRTLEQLKGIVSD